MERPVRIAAALLAVIAVAYFGYTLRHARGSRARAALDFASDAVSVTVTDDGGTDEPDGEVGSGGRGLIGMRERVAMFGGEFDAGPIERGFRVRARLPLTLGGRV